MSIPIYEAGVVMGDVKEPDFSEKVPAAPSPFFDRVKAFFSPSPPVAGQVSPPLTGRIYHVKKRFDTTIEALSHALEKAGEMQGGIREYGEFILPPLIKEGKRLASRLSDTSLDHVRSLTEDARWMEKSHEWLALFEAGDLERIKETLIKQSMNEAVSLVDKDIRLIEEYREQHLESLFLNPEEEGEIRKRLEDELALYLFELRGLKVELPQLSLKEFDGWKAELNKRRETYFNTALSVIDRVCATLASSLSNEENHHHLTEILTQIVDLEKTLPYLTALMKEEGLGKMRVDLLTQITHLREKADHLSLDLRLPPDLQDRLESIVDVLDESKRLLS